MVVYVLLLVVVYYSIEFITAGTPWGKYYFKKQAEEYFKKSYINEQVIDVQIGYSFISGKYDATFYLKSGKSIFISVRDDKRLQGFINE
ncbi:hypothetical protein ABE099_20505 [Paenibacillus turicensis]|uniref:hypothetical protein n=1 Tax=Paenibacillus turicensis TaxID=160487 RepID=UPI003D2D7D0E